MKQGRNITGALLMMLYLFFAIATNVHASTDFDLSLEQGRGKTEHMLEATCTEEDFVLSQKRSPWKSGAGALSIGDAYTDSDKFGSEMTGLAKAFYNALNQAKFSQSTFNFKDTTTGEVLELKGNYITVSYQLKEGESAEDFKKKCGETYGIALVGYLRDYPEKFYWSNGRFGYGTKVDTENPSLIYITLVYAVSPHYTDNLEIEMNQKIQNVVNACTGKNIYTKLKYYHDWLVEQNDYDEDGTGLTDNGTDTWYYAHSAVGCILKGKGVCESYAKAFKLFCDREGIPCMLITSETHMWNYVKIEGKGWYMVDATFDDPINGKGISDTYFLVSNDPAVDRSHILDDMFIYPKTESSQCHDYNELSRKNPTCIEEGYVIYRCSLHGESKKDILPIDISNHVGDTTMKEQKEATKSQNGYTGDLYCCSCGNRIKKGEIIPQTMSVSSLTNTSSGIQIRWKAAEEVDGYYIYRKNGSSSYGKVATVKGSSVVTYTDKNVKSKNGVSYTYAVKAYCKNKVGSYVSAKTIRLTSVTLRSLKNSAKKTMKASWKKNSKAGGYQIQYSTSSSFAKGNKTVTVKGTSALTKAIKSLKKGKKYYARVRVYKKSGSKTFYSAWSSKKSVKIKK